MRRRRRCAKALEGLPEIPEDCQWANFVRNHDELTLDKLSDAERAEVFEAFGPDADLQLYGRGLRRRLPTMLGGDERRMRMLYSLVFSLPGTPVLFYGEEIGMAENLEIEGRNSVRTPMQWSPSGTPASRRSRTPPTLPADHADGWPRRVNVADQRRDGLAAELDGAAHPPPARVPGARLGQFPRCRRPSPRCSRTAATGATARCSPSTRSPTRGLEVRIDLEPGIEEAVDLFDHGHVVPDENGTVTLPLDPYGYRWFRLRRDGQRIAP